MCSPLWSTAWLDEWKKLYPNEDMFNKLITIEDSNSFWDELENHLPYVEHVYIAGGEPFLIKKNYELIEKLSKINKDIVIRYNTNLSNLSIKEKNILTLLKDFNHIEFGLSIDGIGNVGEYIRTGLDTTKWESNLNELLSFKSDRDDKFITSINFDYTFNVMNYLHSFEFVTWITNRVLLNWQDVNGVDTANIQIKANPLHGPEYYNVQWLPMSIKNEFKLRMDEYLTKNKNKLNNTTFESVYVFLNTIYDFSMVGEYDIDLNNEFIKFTNKLDDIRNEDYTKVLDAFLIDKITL
jgi:organic radical activating enzyme